MKYTRADKIEFIKNSNWSKCEIQIVQDYLRELESEDLDNSLHVYEQFSNEGASPHQVVSNYRAAKQRELFGFTDYSLNQYGWMEQVKWLDLEKVEFSAGEVYVSNYIQIGKGKNGKFAIGTNFSVGTSGGGGGVNEYGDIFDTREEAILAGINEVMAKHLEYEERYKKFKDNNYKQAYSKKVVQKMKDFLKEMLNPEPVQLELF